MEKNSRMAKCLWASALFWAGSAAAVDGVIEINQAKALAGGVNGSLVSDPAGFPVVITQPGRYRLTGNLTVPNSNSTAIQVGAAHVDVDLNGFAILGPNLCSGSPTTCSANGTGSGVHAPNPAHVNTVVHDGTVKGMGSTAVALQGWAHVSRVLVQENGATGIFTADHSIIDTNRVILNGGTGISTFGATKVQDNNVAGNGFHGIEGRDNTQIVRNTVSSSGNPAACGLVALNLSSLMASNNTVNFLCTTGGTGVVRLLDCNILGTQRCCPNPATGTDVCS